MKLRGDHIALKPPTPIPTWDTSVSTVNVSIRFDNINNRVVVIANLNAWKALVVPCWSLERILLEQLDEWSTDHFISLDELAIAFVKAEKATSCFTKKGTSQSLIVATLYGSVEIPLSVTICTKYSTCTPPKLHFDLFAYNECFRNKYNTIFKCTSLWSTSV